MVQVGIVGIGQIAQVYIDLMCEGKAGALRAAALCAHREESARAVQRRHAALAGLPVYTDYGQMLSQPGLDAVLICTPHGLHPAMAQQALAAGLPVLVEKPVGIDRSEVQKTVRQLRRPGAPLCGVLYVRRMSGAYQKVRQLLAAGAVGPLQRVNWVLTDLYRPPEYYTTAPWRGSWAGEGGGMLMTQASHQLDLLQWLCGMPVSVRARCATVDRPIEVENEAELLFDFGGGARGRFLASAHERQGENRLEICGREGCLTVTDDRRVELLRADGAPPEVFAFDDSDNRTQQAAMLRNFAQAVETHAAPACPFEEGVRSLEMIEAAYLSAWTGEDCPIPPPEGVFERFYGERCAQHAALWR